MADKNLVLFGAGMTGRGQVAQLAFEDGWQLTFVDKNAALVKALRKAGKYTVHLLSEQPRDVLIDRFTIYHTSEIESIAQATNQADLVVTSVLEPNLPDVGRQLAEALTYRFLNQNYSPLNIIAAENMNNSSSRLKSYVLENLDHTWRDSLEEMIGFPDSMIARVVPVANDPLHIYAEVFSEWTADLNAVKGAPPLLNGLEWVTNQTARLQRKLYIHNTGHAVCGYLGWLKGYTYIHEAAQDPEIMERISAAISESGKAVSMEHGFTLMGIEAYEENLKGRLVISALPDDIRRVIRQPIRKLGKEERFLGPLILCEKYNLPRSGLCYGIAAALNCRMPGDIQFERMAESVDRWGPIGALAELVDYQPDEISAKEILKAYHSFNGIPHK